MGDVFYLSRSRVIEMDSLPSEMILEIVKYMDKTTIQRLSWVGKRYYELLEKKVWSEPRFVKQRSSILQCLKHHSIKVLHSKDFSSLSLNDLIQVKTLERLILDDNSTKVTASALRMFKNCHFGVTLHSEHYHISRFEVENVLLELANVMKEIDGELVINNYWFRRWRVNNLAFLKGVKIKRIELRSICSSGRGYGHERGTNVPNLIRQLYILDVEEVVMVHDACCPWKFTATDLKEMSRLPITEISTAYLRETPYPLEIVNDFKKLKKLYLRVGDTISTDVIAGMTFDYVSVNYVITSRERVVVTGTKMDIIKYLKTTKVLRCINKPVYYVGMAVVFCKGVINIDSYLTYKYVNL